MSILAFVSNQFLSIYHIHSLGHIFTYTSISLLYTYLHVGETGATTWEIAVGFVGSVGVGSTNSSRVPWLGEEGLARGRDKELWPPWVFSMDEGSR